MPMTNSFEFDDKIIYFPNVQYIKTVGDYDQVYMTLGMVHVPSKYGIKEAFLKWDGENIRNKSTNSFNGTAPIISDNDLDWI